MVKVAQLVLPIFRTFQKFLQRDIKDIDAL